MPWGVRMLTGTNQLEKLFIIIASISLLVIIALFILGLMSHSGQAHGLVEGRLKQCPDKPNCVSSERVSDAEHYIEPLVYSADEAERVMPRFKTIIYDMGGSIQVEETNYLAATFTSSLFRFVDDLELRIDADQKTIHLRSASRVGYGDGGANRKRVERLKNLFHLQAD
jgi:uncharacterized protein (DUF1499 family)